MEKASHFRRIILAILGPRALIMHGGSSRGLWPGLDEDTNQSPFASAYLLHISTSHMYMRSVAWNDLRMAPR